MSMNATFAKINSKILLKISESDFDEGVIKAFILDSLLQGKYPEDPKDSEASEENVEENKQEESEGE